MKLRVIGIGRRPGGWVAQALDDYRKRFPQHVRLEFQQLAPSGASDTARRVRDETEMLLRAGKTAQRVALAVEGKPITTEKLANHIEELTMRGGDLALLVGGADGMDASQLASEKIPSWSLSAMTLAHQVVWVVVAEQLYRAVSMLGNHPYHRA